MDTSLLGAAILAAGAGLTTLPRIQRWSATLAARAWTPTLARWLAPLVRPRPYDETAFFRADGATDATAEKRKRGLDALAERCRASRPLTTAWARELGESFSDLRFTDASRVPYPFARLMRDRFDLSLAVTESAGPRLRDLDGQWHLDVGGSYGLNVAGYDRYKAWMQAGFERVRDLGPVLGPLHPVVADNIERLKRISGLAEVSFHMSGTEAVMAAVRLARFNTRRRLVVCFSGAYHGWWDGVQPGLGSERMLDDCLVLKDMHPAALRLIGRRAHEIAAVLVNPVQSFHPNSPPPNDAVLLSSDARRADGSSIEYGEWLRTLARVCQAHDVPLILDEVYTGFRLAAGGAQDYFNVRGDMVVYGKTVAGGMPIGVVCGTHRLMQRVDADRPMRMAYVVGTFSAHPVVMGAMNEFLGWVETDEASAAFDLLNAACGTWAHATNEQLAGDALPVHVLNLGSVWTIVFRAPGRYNWLLQYYLRAQGLSLSWVGTGRCLCSMDVGPNEYAELQRAVVEAARAMRADGWWPNEVEEPGVEKRMRRRLVGDLLGSLIRLPEPLRRFVATVMQRKHDDHEASHSDRVNQALHLFSSSTFIYCYAVATFNLTQAMFLGLGALTVRQFGHAVLEPPCHDKEKLLLGYTTRDKTIIVLGYALVPPLVYWFDGTWTLSPLGALLDQVAWRWFEWTTFVVAARVAYLTRVHDLWHAMVWFVKLVTDPLTDLAAYAPWKLLKA